ncbi:MAG: sugar phosphotransferase [Myxococcaceae bacterium]|nr:sugar phosphotransferase [Myxococcaceae bacterium]
MTPFDPNALPAFLQTRRWFGGKGLPIKAIQVLEQVVINARGDRARDDEEGFTLAVLEVQYPLIHPERYLAPLKVDPDGTIHEAMEDDALGRALFRIIREEKRVPSAGGVMRGEIVGDPSVLRALPVEPGVRRISAEQSNTSLIYEDRVILKLIRKIDIGNNPEWEMGQFLRRNGFRYTPPLLGGIVLEGGPVHSTVAVAHQFVPVESDGWSWALEEMRGAHLSPGFLAEVKKLGARLGELHRILASDPTDPLFAPEPIQTEDLQRWAASIVGELGVTMAAAASSVPELSRRHEELIAHIQRLATVKPSGSKIRIHGDLHLGQTLRTAGEWLIFDFEGEPARTYAQRREKHSPLRDLAGLLRSFAYACASLELKGAPLIDRETPIRKALLQGYLSEATAPGLLPEDDETFDVLLGTMELEKLLYELRYEIHHRPEWVKIPARTLMELNAQKEGPRPA